MRIRKSRFDCPNEHEAFDSSTNSCQTAVSVRGVRPQFWRFRPRCPSAVSERLVLRTVAP
eukprot:372324-Prorocentrum_minimum.AAC.1